MNCEALRRTKPRLECFFSYLILLQNGSTCQDLIHGQMGFLRPIWKIKQKSLVDSESVNDEEGRHRSKRKTLLYRISLLLDSEWESLQTARF